LSSSGQFSSPLIERYPALDQLPRVALTNGPTPVEHLATIHPGLWIKRDDLSADPLGGNKVRALEFLLGTVRGGDRVVTVGSAGSTHVLAVTMYASRLGAGVFVGRWKQVMNATAERVAARIGREAARAPVFRSPVGAYAWAVGRRLRGALWVPAGGSSPLGVLGHVNAGLELVNQIERGALPAPRYVVTPLGTGGTMAGLALAFAIAERDIEVVGVRVVPRIVGRVSHVRSLANRSAALIERVSGTRVPRVRDHVRVEHHAYGGAYGRETTAGREAATQLLETTGIRLDATYSAKAFSHAIAVAESGVTLFWLTFDSRLW